MVEIRVEIPVPLEENARPTYVERNARNIDAVQDVRTDYDNNIVNVTADISSLSEGKAVMTSLNRIKGTKYVHNWNLI